MNKQMKSFRLYLPDMSPEARRRNKKASSRINGTILAFGSVGLFWIGIESLIAKQARTDFGIAMILGGLTWLIAGVAGVRWGRKP